MQIIIHFSAACTRPSGHCAHAGATYEYRDCDGDGVNKIAIDIVFYDMKHVFQSCYTNNILPLIHLGEGPHM